jgi:hypothetical protein
VPVVYLSNNLSLPHFHLLSSILHHSSNHIFSPYLTIPYLTITLIIPFISTHIPFHLLALPNFQFCVVVPSGVVHIFDKHTGKLMAISHLTHDATRSIPVSSTSLFSLYLHHFNQ